MHIAANSTLQLQFLEMNLLEFWIVAEQEFTLAGSKAVSILLFFSTSNDTDQNETQRVLTGQVKMIYECAYQPPFLHARIEILSCTLQRQQCTNSFHSS